MVASVVDGKAEALCSRGLRLLQEMRCHAGGGSESRKCVRAVGGGGEGQEMEMSL